MAQYIAFWKRHAIQ